MFCDDLACGAIRCHVVHRGALCGSVGHFRALWSTVGHPNVPPQDLSSLRIRCSAKLALLQSFYDQKLCSYLSHFLSFSYVISLIESLMLSVGTVLEKTQMVFGQRSC